MFLRRIVDGKAFLLGRERPERWLDWAGVRFRVLTGVSPPEMFTCGFVFKRDNAERFLCVAARRRDAFGSEWIVMGRDGALKTDWTKPLHDAHPYGY